MTQSGIDSAPSALDHSASDIRHNYPFDPTHGYSLEELLKVQVPPEPPDFAAFWESRYTAARALSPRSSLRDTGKILQGWCIHDWEYRSTGQTRIGGWALLPESGEVQRLMIIGHGYGGRDAPDLDLPLEKAALFFPCARGLGRSIHPSISGQSYWHVLHDIQDRNHYVLGGCVEDLWLAVSAALEHFPALSEHVGYTGVSFGGGVGILAAAWESRFQRLHVAVPSFGHQPLRIRLGSVGSAASVQMALRKNPQVLEVLSYYDAAVAARHVRMPVHCACALFDPAVAPAGQFSIYNALAGPKSLFVLQAGHHQHDGSPAEEAALRREVHVFFQDL